MHFKSGGAKPKATLEIGDKTYSIRAPSVKEASDLSEVIESLSGKTKEQGIEMKKFICVLGGIPMEELDSIENELFNDVFEYVITPKKK